MCGKIRKDGQDIHPGMKVRVIGLDGVDYARQFTWGFNNGEIYNARAERMNEYWKSISDNRCVVLVDEFKEGKHFFHIPDEWSALAGIYKNDELALLTVPANKIVRGWHHRMPLIVNENIEN